MSDAPPSAGQDKFIVRLPNGMRDRIKAAAEANNRSMNAEIVATLEEKYPAPKFKRRDLLRLFIQLEPEDQLGLIDYLEESASDPDMVNILRRFLNAQEQLGERLPPDQLDALLDNLRAPKD